MFQHPDNQGGYPPQKSHSLQNYYQQHHGLAMTCAIIVTVLLGPLLGKWTSPLVADLLVEFYGEAFRDELIWLWKALMFAFAFYVSRAYVYAFVVSLSVWAATRFSAFVPPVPAF